MMCGVGERFAGGVDMRSDAWKLKAVWFAVIVVGVGVLTFGCGGGEEREGAEARRAWKEKSHEDFAAVSDGVMSLLKRWRHTRPGQGDDYDAYDISLVIDLDRLLLHMEDGGGPIEDSMVSLPNGYEWGACRVTPDGHERLGRLVRLKLRAKRFQSNLCQELFHVQALLGKEDGFWTEIRSTGGGMGTGRAIIDTYEFKDVTAGKDAITESLLEVR